MKCKKASNNIPCEMELNSGAIPGETDNSVSKMSQLRIMKNLTVVCLGFLFLFSAYQALANLQSTLNMEGNLGVVSQSVIYAALILSSVLLPKLVIRKFGCKVTLVLSILTYAPYIAANFYPHMSTFIPTAIIVGIGAAPLWSAKCTYLNEISSMYAGYGTETADVVTSRFFGIFFMVFQNTQVWGNLVSFLVLKPSPTNSSNVDSDLHVGNISCGVNFCSGINENLKPPTEEKRYMLIAIYLSCVLLAALIVAAFLDPLPKKKKKVGEEESVCSRVVATLKHLKKTNQLLLVPLTIFSGVEQGFILGDYTKAYVACAWGIYYVGLVFVCFGVVNAIMSFFAGRLVKYVSRMTIMFAAAAGNLCVCVVLFLWEPSADHPEYFFLIVGLWGMSDAIWQTQINALYGVLFRSDEEANFGNYRLWESLGFSLAFGYSTFLCVAAKIYVLLAFLIVGMAGYAAVEARSRAKKKTYDINN